MKHTLSILTLLVATTLAATAQKSSWTFFAGWNQALGDFAKADLATNDWAFVSPGSTKGGAGYGFDIGVSHQRPFGDNSKASLVLSADFIYTGAAYTIRNNTRMLVAEASNNFAKASVTNPHFASLPILGGLHYEFGLGGSYSLYLEAQAGFAYRWISNRGAEFVDGQQPISVGGEAVYDYIYTDHFHNSASLAFHFSVGLVEKGHWIADFGVWHMGSQKVEGYEDFSISSIPGLLRHGSMPFSVGTIAPFHYTLRIGYRL